MAYLDRDASVKSGRSHASSARSRAAPSTHVPSGGDMFSAAASGVLSMLKTSTDSGDIGDLSFNTSRLPSMPRPTHRRRTNVARLSASSHHSNNSYTPSHLSKRNSSSQAWDAVSAISQGTYGRHTQQGSLTSLQTMQTQPSYAPETRSSLNHGVGKPSPYESSRLAAPFSPDGRSYSLTQPQPSFALKPHRSATSLRSQGSGPYPSQRHPYAYPARLKRPGYRAPSPVSDFGGPPYPSMYGAGPPTSDGPFFDPGLDRGQGASYTHNYPSSQRSHKGPAQRPLEGNFGLAKGPPHGRSMRRPPMPAYNSDYGMGTSFMRSVPDNQRQLPRQATPKFSTLTIDRDQAGFRPGQMHGGHLYPLPPYGVHHHFPPHIHEPVAQSLPSSSDQGSSAPPSSSPPTPNDCTTVQVTVDPAFIDPAFSDLPDEHTEPNGFPNYLKYTERACEIHELDAVEPAAAELAAELSPARGGFVQRIKDLLEDRSSTIAPNARSPPPQLSQISPFPSISDPEIVAEIQARQDPLDLPTAKGAIVVEPAELEAPARLTRALIKANTAPSSSDQNTVTSQALKTEDGFHKDPENKVSTDNHKEVEDDDGASVTITSSPPQALPSVTSVDLTVISKASSDAEEMDYAMQLDVPEPLRPDFAKWPLPFSSNSAKVTVEEQSDDPVSPLRSGEEALRDSLVSPMPTQTMQVAIPQDHPGVPDSLPNEKADSSFPPLKRMSDHLSADFSTQFSMPPDLSLLSAQDAASEAVTDVAVRFSIPNTADRAKPQLVSVSTTAEPATSHIDAPAKLMVNTKPLRESFFNIEKVAPLRVKKPEATSPTHVSIESADLSSFIRRSFPRRQSIWPGDRADSKCSSGEPILETRFPGMKSPPGRLPGLKEESQEDMSIKDYRSSGLRLPVPSLDARAVYDPLKGSEDARGPSYLPSRAPRMTLAELRNIPSLNFSRLDLIDKLNEALEVRSSKSVEVVRRRDFSGIYCPSPLRPSSTEALRERYTSFFDKPEDFQVPEPPYVDTSDDEGLTNEIPKGDIEETHLDDFTEASSGVETGPDFGERQPSSPPEIHAMSPSLRASSPSVRPMSRPLSPEDFMNVTHEVNRLAVPSVATLAERLSELLPSIRHLNLDSAIADDRAVRETLDEIHHLGHRLGSEALLRSSTGLRHLAAAADNIATNGTHDSMAYDAKTERIITELPPLLEDTEKFSLSDSGLDKNTSLGTEALSSLAPNEVEVPKPALLRVRSLNDIEDGDQMHPGYPGSATKRSIAPSTHHSRPWNLDEYYPWTGNSVSIDIDFPKPILRRNTSASTVLRRSKVSSDSASDISERSETGRTTGARSPLSGQSTVLLEASPTIESTIHSRKISKRSIIGSLSRKIGLGGYKAKSGLQTSVLPESPYPTKPGDRYPSTALLPPNAFNLDEVRSFFSDSTSDGSDKRGSFRKHINILRSRLPGGPATLSSSRIHSIDAEHNASLDNHGRPSQARHSASLFDDRFTEPGSAHTYEGMAGMGKVEFRVKKVTERLRYVLLKTTEMIRTLSHKRKPAQRRLRKERERAEWLDDSLYSGT